MSLYIVEAEKLANKFGVFRKGEKFNADKNDPELKELVKNGDVKNVRPVAAKPVEEEVDDTPLNLEVVDTEDTDEVVEPAKGKKRK